MKQSALSICAFSLILGVLPASAAPRQTSPTANGKNPAPGKPIKVSRANYVTTAECDERITELEVEDANDSPQEKAAKLIEKQALEAQKLLIAQQKAAKPEDFAADAKAVPMTETAKEASANESKTTAAAVVATATKVVVRRAR